MDIIISNSSGVPIYEQIKEQIKVKIISGELGANEALPSIRLLAKELRCSVITTKNAYEELVNEGFIINVPSKGFYVSEINHEVVREELLNKIQGHLDSAVSIAKNNNISKDIVLEMLDILYEENK